MGFPGGIEMVIVVAVILLLFGSSKVPTLMRNLGKSANEFKRGMSDDPVEEETTTTKLPPSDKA